MSRASLFFASLFILAQANPASTADFSTLLNWAGSYPTRDMRGKPESILDDRYLKPAINGLLERSDIKKLRDYAESTPIEAVDDFIVIKKCQAHNCAPDRATIVLDTKKDRIWVGFFARFSTKVVTRWYGNVDNYSVLPDKILRDFQEKQ